MLFQTRIYQTFEVRHAQDAFRRKKNGLVGKSQGNRQN